MTEWQRHAIYFKGQALFLGTWAVFSKYTFWVHAGDMTQSKTGEWVRQKSESPLMSTFRCASVFQTPLCDVATTDKQVQIIECAFSRVPHRAVASCRCSVDGDEAVGKGAAGGFGQGGPVLLRAGSKGWSPRTSEGACGAADAWRSTGEAGNSPASTPDRQPSSSMHGRDAKLAAGAAGQPARDGAREDSDSDISVSDLVETDSLAAWATAAESKLQTASEADGARCTQLKAGIHPIHGGSSTTVRTVLLPGSAAGISHSKANHVSPALPSNAKEHQHGPAPSKGSLSALERLASTPASPGWQIAAVSNPRQRQQQLDRNVQPQQQQAVVQSLCQVATSGGSTVSTGDATMELDVAPDDPVELAEPEVRRTQKRTLHCGTHLTCGVAQH